MQGQIPAGVHLVGAVAVENGIVLLHASALWGVEIV